MFYCFSACFTVSVRESASSLYFSARIFCRLGANSYQFKWSCSILAHTSVINCELSPPPMFGVSENWLTEQCRFLQLGFALTAVWFCLVIGLVTTKSNAQPNVCVFSVKFSFQVANRNYPDAKLQRKMLEKRHKRTNAIRKIWAHDWHLQKAQNVWKLTVCEI